MNFLEYSNTKHVNVIQRDKFQELITEVFGTVSENLAVSLGPLGSQVTILDGMNTSATKDGFEILKNIRFHNKYKSLIFNLIKAPCTRLNNTVGDGTTTVIVLTNEMFRNYKGRESILERTYRLPRELTRTWDEMIQGIIDRVKSYATPLNSEDYTKIYNLCYVTSNGNAEISKNIADVYRETKSPSIKLKRSPTNKSYISPIDGYEFPANLVDSIYSNTEDLSVEEKDIRVMIFNYKLDEETFSKLIFPVNEVLRSQGEKLLILAPYYDAHVMDSIIKKYVNYELQKYKSLNLVLGQYDTGKLEKHQLNDLAVVLSCNILDQETVKSLTDNTTPEINEEFYDLVNEMKVWASLATDGYGGTMGLSTCALLSCVNGSIFKVSNNIEEVPAYKNLLAQIESELEGVKSNIDNERQAYAFEVSKIQSRISRLKMHSYIYYVGSDSVLQTNILYDAVDDVVKCVRSAIRSGFVPGCQLSIIRACNEIIQEIVTTVGTNKFDEIPDVEKQKICILEIIRAAVTGVYISILCGPEKTGIMRINPLWKFIDATNKDAVQELILQGDERCNDIIRQSVEKNKVFDLEIMDHTDTIITSTETDVNVLLAASELVKLLISGNQCVFLDTSVNDSHNETIEARV